MCILKELANVFAQYIHLYKGASISFVETEMTLDHICSTFNPIKTQ